MDDITVSIRETEAISAVVKDASDHTFEVSDLGEFVVEGRSGWETMYRLRHKMTDQATAWTLYERAMMLEVLNIGTAQIETHVCVSPYYTEFDNFKIMTPVEALKYLCAVEVRPMDDVQIPVFEVDESGLEAELEDDDIPGTE